MNLDEFVDEGGKLTLKNYFFLRKFMMKIFF